MLLKKICENIPKLKETAENKDEPKKEKRRNKRKKK